MDVTRGAGERLPGAPEDSGAGGDVLEASATEIAVVRSAENLSSAMDCSTALPVGGHSGDLFADHQGVNVVCTLIRLDGFEVANVAHDRVLVHDAVSA